MTFEEFATTQLQPLLRYAVMLTGDPHLAEDLVQDVMVRARLKWRRVAAAHAPEFYVRRMLTNAYADWRRASWWRRTTLAAEPPEPEPPHPGGDHAVRSAERDEVWNLLATLGKRQRAALVLRFYEGLTDAEIAEILDCTVSTVRSQISRALGTLRAALAAPGPMAMMEALDDRG